MLNKIWKLIRKTRLGPYLTGNEITISILKYLYNAVNKEGVILFKTPIYEIYLDTRDGGVGRRYIIDGEHEGFEKDYVTKNVKFDIFYDIGANIGDWTLYVAAVNPKCKIYAFEPHPLIFKNLLKSIDVNKYENIEVQNFGLGDIECSLDLMCDPENQGNNSICVKPEAGNISLISIEIKRASDYIKLKPAERILVKIDVQGYEENILRALKYEGSDNNISFLIEIDKNTTSYTMEWISQRMKEGKKLTILDGRLEESLMIHAIEDLPDNVSRRTYFDLLIS
jgi:FkbM family methyltransferase